MKLQIPDADVLWDELPVARKHEIEVTVDPGDLDDLNHVNNTVYLAWCEAVARAHALRVGMGTGALIALGAVPVARQHTIVYHRPTLLGDRVRVRTAVTVTAGVRSVRAYAIDRLDSEDPDTEGGTRLAECQTEWVWVDPGSGRPKRIPAEIARAFGF